MSPYGVVVKPEKRIPSQNGRYIAYFLTPQNQTEALRYFCKQDHQKYI